MNKFPLNINDFNLNNDLNVNRIKSEEKIP